MTNGNMINNSSIQLRGNVSFADISTHHEKVENIRLITAMDNFLVYFAQQSTLVKLKTTKLCLLCALICGMLAALL